MSSERTDIVVLGATGFTGSLITRYLYAHPQYKQGLFSFAVAARSQSKLHTLVQQLSLPATVNTIQVDVTDDAQIEHAVKSARVVINTVGPYWHWGTPVVRACAKNGVHYVDLTGETHWIKDIIDKYDYLATKTGAVIVTSCGMDSIPSDVSVFLSNKKLKSLGPYDAGTSITAHDIRGGVSGGSFSTVMSVIEEVPRDKLRESSIPYALSPVRSELLPTFKFLYKLPISRSKTIHGGYFFMQPTNRALVERTFGLLEIQALDAEEYLRGANTSRVIANSAELQRERYGPKFAYDEFLVTSSAFSAILLSTASAVAFIMLAFVRPFRWFMKKIMPSPGEGPSDEYMEKGHITSTNVTISTSDPPVRIKSVFKGNGDPGYLLTAIMISESALSFLLPPPSRTSASHVPPVELPILARRGGVLTPMTALGDALIARLAETGRFQFETEVLDSELRAPEPKKTV